MIVPEFHGVYQGLLWSDLQYASCPSDIAGFYLKNRPCVTPLMSRVENLEPTHHLGSGTQEGCTRSDLPLRARRRPKLF